MEQVLGPCDALGLADTNSVKVGTILLHFRLSQSHIEKNDLAL